MDIRHMVGMARYNLRMQSIIWSALLALAMFMTVMNSKASADDTVRYERVLAIGGAVTEIVYALGEQDRLIGRDSTSTWPAEATELPDVGYMRALSPEGVLSVKPDLILARENSGPAEAIEVLKGAGVNWVDVPDNFTVQGIDDNIRIIAQALGVEDKGDALRAEVREELDGAAAQIAAVTDPKRAMFILSMRDNRVMASGTETAANGILGLAGAQNVISEFTGYKQLSDEAVITAAPDVIVMMRGRGGSSDHAAANEVLQSHPALSTTPAVKNGNIIRVDGLLMLGFGPRTGQAALELAKMIYPDELN